MIIAHILSKLSVVSFNASLGTELSNFALILALAETCGIQSWHSLSSSS